MKISAPSIAQALGGKRIGAYWMAPCPAHDDRIPSLSIRDAEGKVLVHCHAGCDQAKVIAAMRERGLWPNHISSSHRHAAHRTAIHTNSDFESPPSRWMGQNLWLSAKPAKNSLVQRYLQSRHIELSPPPALRLHDGLMHPSGSRWPCMIALVVNGVSGQPTGLHRTFIAKDGQSKAPVEPNKMMLGQCRGGIVRLAEPSHVLLIGEGIETCLSAMAATGYPAWAALSTSGMRALYLPSGVRNIVVLADGDEAGRSASRDCALRWKREGRFVRIAYAPNGTDFNDLLIGQKTGNEDIEP